MTAQKISVNAKTISKAIEAFYLNELPEASFKITKQTLKAPLTPKPAIIVKIINIVIS